MLSGALWPLCRARVAALVQVWDGAGAQLQGKECLDLGLCLDGRRWDLLTHMVWDGQRTAMDDTQVYAWTMRRMEFIDGKSWVGLRGKCECEGGGAHVETRIINPRFRVEART